MIAFAIPTWNRVEKLKKAINSIFTQFSKMEFPFHIYVSDNASSDGTAQYLAELKKNHHNVSYQLLNQHVDYAENFRNALLMPSKKTEWVWFHSDDDYLLDGAAENFYTNSKSVEHDVSLMYACQAKRVSEKKVGLLSLGGLANDYGFHEILGWMSSLIMRYDRVVQMTNLDIWSQYSKSSFVHSCAFYHVANLDKVSILNFPMVNPQEDSQSSESLERWKQEKISDRYFFLSDAFLYMKSKGVFDQPLKPSFFRYHQYHLWDRLVVQLLISYLRSGGKWHDEYWIKILNLVSMLEDSSEKKYLSQSLTSLKRLIDSHLKAKAQFNDIDSELRSFGNSFNKSTYKFNIF